MAAAAAVPFGAPAAAMARQQQMAMYGGMAAPGAMPAMAGPTPTGTGAPGCVVLIR